MSSCSRSDHVSEKAALLRARGENAYQMRVLAYEQYHQSSQAQAKILKSAGVTSLEGHTVVTNPLPYGFDLPADLCRSINPAPFVMLKSAGFIMKEFEQSLPQGVSCEERPTEQTRISYIKIDPSAILTNSMYRTALMSFLSVYFAGRDGRDRSPLSRYYQAYCSLLCSVTKDITPVVLTSMLASRSMVAVQIDCETEEELVTVTSELFPDFPAFFNTFDTEQSVSIPHLLAIMSVILQTIGRQMSDKGIDKWYSNRYKSACGALGAGQPIEHWAAYHPKLESINEAHNMLSSAFDFRRFVFCKLAALAQSTTPFGNMCAHTVHMLMYAECSYILTVDRFLTDQYPELLVCKMLAGEERALGNMYAFMKAQGDKAPYVKLLVHGNNCKPIHRELIIRSITAATIIGSETHPSFQNFYINRNSDFYLKMRDFITAWIELRRKMDPVTMLGDPVSRMSENARRDAVLRLQAQMEAAEETSQIIDISETC